MKRGIILLSIMITLFTTLPVRAQLTSAWLEKLEIEQYHNKVVYLSFWASWCGPCRNAFPWLNSIQKKYKDRGLVVIAVNLDSDITRAKLFIKKVPVQFLLYSDPRGEMARQYRLTGLPSFYLLSREGKVQGRHLGFRKSKVKSAEAHIVKLLNLLAAEARSKQK